MMFIRLAQAMLLVGCDGQPYKFEVDRICRNLNTQTNTNEIRAWFEREVLAASSSRTNSPPAKIEVRKLPLWAESLFGNSPPSAVLFLDVDEKKSHIDLVWAHGRGMAGIIIGGDEYKPNLGGDYFLREYAPRIFVYAPKHFP